MTIFQKIIDGEIPCHKVYEDDRVLAFLDINPLSEGHTLIIPKEPAVTIGELSDDSAAALGRAMPRIARAVIKAVGAEAYNLVQMNGEDAGQEVMHVHFHVIPRFPDREAGGLRVTWKPNPFDHDDGAKLAEKMRGQLG
jgi:histidine triad (HIT) family protein